MTKKEALKKVKNDGAALEYVDNSFKKDKEIVDAASRWLT